MKSNLNLLIINLNKRNLDSKVINHLPLLIKKNIYDFKYIIKKKSKVINFFPIPE